MTNGRQRRSSPPKGGGLRDTSPKEVRPLVSDFSLVEIGGITVDGTPVPGQRVPVTVTLSNKAVVINPITEPDSCQAGAVFGYNLRVFGETSAGEGAVTSCVGTGQVRQVSLSVPVPNRSEMTVGARVEGASSGNVLGRTETTVDIQQSDGSDGSDGSNGSDGSSPPGDGGLVQFWNNLSTTEKLAVGGGTAAVAFTLFGGSRRVPRRR